MKCVKIYTLKFHEQNNEVLIDMNSYLRKIACNEFINFYKFLIFSKENPSLVHISLKQTKSVREGFSIVSIIIEFLQRLHSDRKV